MKKLILLSSILLASTAQAASTHETRTVKTTETTDVSRVSSDQKVEQAVKDSISSGLFSKGYDRVTVRVNNGHVILGGFVSTMDDKNKVEKEVQKVEGVRSLSNNIQVKDVTDKK